MAEDLGDARLELSTDQTKLDRELDQAKTKTKGFLSDVQATLKKVGSTAAGASLIGNVGANIVRDVQTMAFDVGRSIGDFIHTSIEAASNLNETLSKTRAVFKGSAPEIIRWGEGAAQALGMSENAALGAAAGFGNLFNGLPETRGQAADFSKTLVELAGDLASFNNLDPTEALDKLKSGLAGEAEPLRSVGVFLTEAKVKAKAMQLGLAGAHGELTEGAKVLARYHLILDETKSAQGDFARTSDQLANSQRKANAELENAQASLGEKMLPAQLAVTNAQIDLFSGLNAFSDMLSGKLTPEVLALNQAMGVGADKYHFTAEQMAGMTEETLRTAQALGILTQAQVDAELASRHFNASANAMGDSLADVAERGSHDAAEIRGSIGSIGTKARSTATSVGLSMHDIAKSISDARRSIVDSVQEVIDQAYDPLILAAEITATKIELAEQRKTLASSKSTAAEKREARQRILELEKTLATQLNQQTQYGTDSERLARLTGRAQSRELVAGLKSGDAARKAASKAAAADLASGIIALMNKTHTYGLRTGNAYVDGLIASFEERRASVRRAFAGLKPFFEASSPPGPESPLHLVDVWGFRTGDAWIRPMIAAIEAGRRGVRGSVGAIAGDLTSTRFPSLTASIATRAMSGAAPGSGPAAAAATATALAGGVSRETPGGVSKQYIQNVRLEGPPKARDPLGVAVALGRFARTGELEDAYEKGPAADG